MAAVRSKESIERAVADSRRCSNFFLRLLLFICFVALGIFICVAYPMLRAEHVQMVLPGTTSFTNWHKDAMAQDYHVRDSESKMAGLNQTFLKYASIDPTEQPEKRKIKMLLDGNQADMEFRNSRIRWNYQQRRMDHYVDIGRRQSRSRPRYESWLLQLQSPRYDASWPRFRQLLQEWSRKKKHDPHVMAELVAILKIPIDKFYKGRAKGSQQHQQPVVEPEAPRDREERYKTCAVVGNSGILLNRSSGPFIDGHDVVIRLNNARVKGFEDSVGAKTTLSFVNSNIYHSCSRRLNCFCHPYGNIPIVLYMCQVQHLMDIAFCEPHNSAPVLVTDPRLDNLCARLVKWYSVKNYVETTGNPILQWAKEHNPADFHYSSGFQAVVLALGICDRVDILGFGKDPLAKHHYHTNQKAELTLHDYAAEYLFYDDLALSRTSSIPFLSEAGIHLPPVTIYR